MKKAPGKSYREGISLEKLFQMFPDDATAEKWFVEAVFVRCRDCPCAINEIVIESMTNGRIREISQWITRNIRAGYQE